MDWYALGITIYELLHGKTPFTGNCPIEIYNKILEQKIYFPQNFDKRAKHLVKNLCRHDLTKRYGNIASGI